MQHNLHIPAHLHTAIQAATLLRMHLITRGLLDALSEPDTELELDPDAWEVPTDPRDLASSLEYGFTCHFGGFAAEGTPYWDELKHLRTALDDVLTQDQPKGV